MSDYSAPLADMHFALDEAADLEGLAALPAYESLEADLVGAILEEAARLAGEVLSRVPAPRVTSSELHARAELA